MLSKNAAENNLFGSGLRGIIFVTSVLDYVVADQSGEEGSPISPTSEALKMWGHAQQVAQLRSVPCFLVLSKCDLLGELDGELPAGMSPAAVEAALRAQAVLVDGTEGPLGDGRGREAG